MNNCSLKIDSRKGKKKAKVWSNKQEKRNHLQNRLFAFIRVGHGANLFPFHAPVLEPNFNLPLGQAEAVGDLDPSPPGQVAIKVEFFLQFQRLVARVRRPLAFRFSISVDCVYLNKQTNNSPINSLVFIVIHSFIFRHPLYCLNFEIPKNVNLFFYFFLQNFRKVCRVLQSTTVNT